MITHKIFKKKILKRLSGLLIVIAFSMPTPGLALESAKGSPVRDKWALIVGIGQFQNGNIPQLKFANKDARDFRDFLVNEANFSPDHVRLLLDDKATQRRVLSELGTKFLARVAKPDDLVVIYFSTHGSSSQADIRGKNFIVAYDSDPEDLFSTGIEMDKILESVDSRVLSKRVLLVLDACHSGVVTKGAKGLSRSGNFDAEKLAQGSGQLVITSSSPEQISFESKRYNNGIFTHKLIEGLRINGRKTTLGEAFPFIQSSVSAESQEDYATRQIPNMKSKWDGNELVLAQAAAHPQALPLAVIQILEPDSSPKTPVKRSPGKTPAESKPAESKPAESKPSESKPSESKPAESKPAESSSGEIWAPRPGQNPAPEDSTIFVPRNPQAVPKHSGKKSSSTIYSYPKAVALYNNGDFASCVGILNNVILQKAGNTADAHYTLANAYAKIGKIPEALNHYRESLKLHISGKKAAYCRQMIGYYTNKTRPQTQASSIPAQAQAAGGQVSATVTTTPQLPVSAAQSQSSLRDAVSAELNKQANKLKTSLPRITAAKRIRPSLGEILNWSLQERANYNAEAAARVDRAQQQVSDAETLRKKAESLTYSLVANQRAYGESEDHFQSKRTLGESLASELLIPYRAEIENRNKILNDETAILQATETALQQLRPSGYYLPHKTSTNTNCK